MIREFQSKGLMDYTRSLICIAFDHAIFGDPPPAPHRCPNTGNDGAKLDPDEFLASQIGNSGKNEDSAKVVEKRPKVTPSLVTPAISPLPGLDEADLLRRAMDRRAMLHERISAMEAARARLGSSFEGDDADGNANENRNDDAGGGGGDDVDAPSLRGGKRERRRRMGQRTGTDDDEVDVVGGMGRPFDEGGGGGGGGIAPPDLTRMGMDQHDLRMNALSEQIKREALEFMGHESAYAGGYVESPTVHHRDRVEEGGGIEEGVDDGVAGGVDDYDGIVAGSGDVESELLEWLSTPPKSRRGSSGRSDSASIDSSAWTMDDGTTPQQLSRFSNMVRLGIPDVAVLRSIERESVPHAESVLISIKKRNADTCMASTTTTADTAGSSSAGRGSIPQDCRNEKVPSRERHNGFEKIERAIPPLCDDPNYR